MKISIQKIRSFVLNPNILLVLVIALASFLRLYGIQDYMTFLGDEGRDVLVVYNILHGKLTLLGPTASVGGFFLGPIYYYFMAPFLWLFNYNPVGPAIMVALFGVATIYLLYRFSSEFFNKKVGLLAAFLYSISPIVIAYSRSSWNPNLMPFFSLASLYVLYKGIRSNNWKLFLLTGFLLGISMQLHYLTFFLGAVVFAYLLVANVHKAFLTRPSIQFVEFLKENILVFTGFTIGLLPFLAFEARHGFQNISSIFRFIVSSGDTGTGIAFIPKIYDVFFRLFARLVATFPQPEQISTGQYPYSNIWMELSLVLGITALVVLIYNLIRTFSLSKNQEGSIKFYKYSLLFVWLVLGIGLFGFYKKPIYDYYFGFMFTLPFILTGYAFDFLSSKNKILKVICILGFTLLTYVNLRGAPFRFLPNRQLNQVKTISEFVLKKAENKPFNFALITGGNSDHAYRYFFTLENKDPVIIENPVVDPMRNTITDQLLIVCEGPCHPLGNSLWEVAGFGRAEIVGEWDVIVVKVYKLVHYKEK